MGIYTQFPFSSFKESIATAFSIVFGNAWYDVFYRSLVQYDHAASIYFFLVVLICKQIIFSIIVAFLLEHMKKLLEKINSDKKKRMIQKINRMKEVGIAATLKKLKPSRLMREKLKSVVEGKKSFSGAENQAKEASISDSMNNSYADVSAYQIPFSRGQDLNAGKLLLPGSHRSIRDTPFKDLLNISSQNLQPAFDRSKALTPNKTFQINLQEANKSPSVFSVSRASLQSGTPNLITSEILSGVVKVVNTLYEGENIDIDEIKRRAAKRKQEKKKSFAPPQLPGALFQSPDIKSMMNLHDTDRPMLDQSMVIEENRHPEALNSMESNLEGGPKDTEERDNANSSSPVLIHWKKREFPRQGSLIQHKDSFCKRRMDSALFILHKRSPAIFFLQENLEKPALNYFLVFMTLAAVVVMALNDPYVSPESTKGQALKWTEVAINSMFTIEFILRALANGLIFEVSRKKPCFRQKELIIDFMVTIITWISLLLPTRVPYLLCLKPFRIIRLFIFLRNVGRSNSFSLILSTISGAAVKTSVFVAFVFLSLHPHVVIRMFTHGEPFLICRVKGELRTYLAYACPPDIQGETLKVETDFMTYLNALLSSFVVLTNEGFFKLSLLMMHNQINRQLSFLYIIETILSYYFMGQFLQNMFACVTILNYSEKKQTMDRTSNLTERELKIFDQQLVFIRKDLLKLSENSRSNSRLHKMMLSTLFYDALSFMLLIVIIVLICLTGSNSKNLSIEIVLIIMLAWNNIEVALKVSSMGILNYLKDNFNCIDLVSVGGCDILLILNFSTNIQVNFMTPILIKVLGLGRVLRRLLKSEHRLAKGMKSIFDALIRSFIYLLPMLAIIIITLTGFAITGMHLFSSIAYQTEINRAFNFQTFVPSFMVMLKLLTGHKWQLTLAELVGNGPESNCQPNYSQGMSSNGDSCGEVLGYAFVLLYIIVSRFVLLNLITVLVIDGYLESRKLENMSFKDSEVEMILQTWALFDPDRTGLMKCNDFILFLYQMPEPFGVDKAKNNVTAKDLLNKFFSSEDNRIIVTIKDLMDAVKRYQLVVYQANDEHYVHFVDYISFITNKVNANSKAWSTLDLGPKLFLHFKLTDHWKKKFPKYSYLEKKEDFAGRPSMLLQHFYAYKIVVRKIMSYSRLNRLKNKPFIGTGKEVVRNLCVEGSNMTRNKPLAYLYYNNLIQSKAPDNRNAIPQDTVQLSVELNRANTTEYSVPERRVHRKPSRRIGSPKKDHNSFSMSKKGRPGVPELEAEELNLDPIFNEKDIERADHPYSSSHSSNHDSM